MKPQASPTLPSTDGSSGCIDPRRSSGRPPATAQACGLTGLGDKPCGTSRSRKTASPAVTGMLSRPSAKCSHADPCRITWKLAFARPAVDACQSPQYWPT